MDMYDVVNNPKHYKSNKGLETIDVIEAFTENLEGMQAVCQGHILRYICRWPKKNGLEDLKKAQFYLEMLIASEEERKDNDNDGPYSSKAFEKFPYMNTGKPQTISPYFYIGQTERCPCDVKS